MAAQLHVPTVPVLQKMEEGDREMRKKCLGGNGVRSGTTVATKTRK